MGLTRTTDRIVSVFCLNIYQKMVDMQWNNNTYTQDKLHYTPTHIVQMITCHLFPATGLVWSHYLWHLRHGRRGHYVWSQEKLLCHRGWWSPLGLHHCSWIGWVKITLPCVLSVSTRVPKGFFKGYSYRPNQNVYKQSFSVSSRLWAS